MMPPEVKEFLLSNLGVTPRGYEDAYIYENILNHSSTERQLTETIKAKLEVLGYRPPEDFSIPWDDESATLCAQALLNFQHAGAKREKEALRRSEYVQECGKLESGEEANPETLLSKALRQNLKQFKDYMALVERAGDNASPPLSQKQKDTKGFAQIVAQMSLAAAESLAHSCHLERSCDTPSKLEEAVANAVERKELSASSPLDVLLNQSDTPAPENSPDFVPLAASFLQDFGIAPPGEDADAEDLVVHASLINHPALESNIIGVAKTLLNELGFDANDYHPDYNDPVEVAALHTLLHGPFSDADPQRLQEFMSKHIDEMKAGEVIEKLPPAEDILEEITTMSIEFMQVLCNSADDRRYKKARYGHDDPLVDDVITLDRMLGAAALIGEKHGLPQFSSKAGTTVSAAKQIGGILKTSEEERSFRLM